MLRWLVCVCLVQATLAYPGLRTQEEIEEFRSFLQKTKQDGDTTLEEAMAKNPKALPWENSGKYQGDILLFDEEVDELVAGYAANVTDMPASRNGLVNTVHRWPQQTIHYDIAPNTFSNSQLNMIQRGLDFFHTTTCVRWVRRTNQHDFVLITGRQTGCYAHVGYWRNFGAHTLNLASGCFNLMIVIHEMLHSAGFHHMHQTYNRYDWVWINWQNVQQGTQHNFNVFSNQVVTMLGLPYEYGSNQHYSAHAFSSNGQPTIGRRFVGDGGTMGQLTHVTGWDIWRLARMYNCPGAWGVTVNAEDINKPYDESFAQRLREAAEKDTAEKEIDDNVVPVQIQESINEELNEGEVEQ